MDGRMSILAQKGVKMPPSLWFTDREQSSHITCLTDPSFQCEIKMTAINQKLISETKVTTGGAFGWFGLLLKIALWKCQRAARVSERVVHLSG